MIFIRVKYSDGGYINKNIFEATEEEKNSYYVDISSGKMASIIEDLIDIVKGGNGNGINS